MPQSERFEVILEDLERIHKQLPPVIACDPKFTAEIEVDFERYASPVLANIGNNSSTAERKLQCALMIPLNAICRLANSIAPYEATFVYDLEPVVSSVPSPRQPRIMLNQVSDYEISQMLTIYNSSGTETDRHRKMVALIELKHGDFPIIKAKPFSQLIHAAALAYNSKLWNGKLLCCLASLKYWHVFVLAVPIASDSSEDKFVISSYFREICACDKPLVEFYKGLILKLGMFVADFARPSVAET